MIAGVQVGQSKITKPMLAAVLKDVNQLDFSKGYLCTPKIDGIRALMIDGHLVSRTFKPIRNNYIRKLLEGVLPDGADGEIVCPGAFQATTSGVMSEDGEPEFIFYWFDYVKDDLKKPYEARIYDLLNAHDITQSGAERVQPLIPVVIKDLAHLKKYEQECIDNSFEGVILRIPDSPYKCGRSTAKQEWLLKLKRFADDEAIVIGFAEKFHNDNEATKDAFGHTVRSSHKENKRPAGTLGALIVKDIKTDIEFEIGTGFDDKLRQEIWDDRDKYMDKIVRYRHFNISGAKDKPRFPSFDGFRDKDDM